MLYFFKVSLLAASRAHPRKSWGMISTGTSAFPYVGNVKCDASWLEFGISLWDFSMVQDGDKGVCNGATSDEEDAVELTFSDSPSLFMVNGIGAFRPLRLDRLASRLLEPVLTGKHNLASQVSGACNVLSAVMRRFPRPRTVGVYLLHCGDTDKSSPLCVPLLLLPSSSSASSVIWSSGMAEQNSGWSAWNREYPPT